MAVWKVAASLHAYRLAGLAPEIDLDEFGLIRARLPQYNAIFCSFDHLGVPMPLSHTSDSSHIRPGIPSI